MNARIEMLPAFERVRILAECLENLELGSGEFRPSNRSMAIKECRRKLEEARANLRGIN